jgi:bleomycin hydrolase
LFSKREEVKAVLVKRSDCIAFRLKIFSAIFLSAVLQGYSLCAQSIKGKLETALGSLPHPQSVKEFASIPHLSAMHQDSTLVCWSFATSSFIESEMKRLGREPVRLSVMFPVYFGFIEKAKHFVQSRGESRFNPGDLFSGVIDVMQQYGAVPMEAYEGTQSGHAIFNHNALYAELDSVMNRAKRIGDWNGELILANVRNILNTHLGSPPEKFLFNGIEYSPCTFSSNVVCMPFDDYLMVTSFLYAPFNQFIELKVPDNWKHHTNYFNVPLDLFYYSLKNAIARKYSLALDMDNSEPSYRITKQYAFLPEFDIPKDSLAQSKREALFQSGATTDDHLVHVVSYKKYGCEDWYLVKDSWRAAWEGPNDGYFFFHESYMKLKVLAFFVHRDAVPEITKLQLKQ